MANEILYYLIPFSLVLVFSIAGAFIRREGSFSVATFLLGFSVGILMLIATGVFPIYTILFNVIIIVGFLFSNIGG